MLIFSLHFPRTLTILIPGELVHIFYAKQLGILEKWLQKYIELYISDDDSSCGQHHPYFKHSNINSGDIACSWMKHFPWDLTIVEIPLLTKFEGYP